MFKDSLLQAIGEISSPISDSMLMPPSGELGKIIVFPEYAKALKRVEEYSFLWVLTWFDQADRDTLTAIPVKVDPTAQSFGVFALRSPSRPNPIGLTLVRLISVEGEVLQVAGLDAIDGTPVLDIKPYFEHDTVFSPRTARIVACKKDNLYKTLWSHALKHHGEECSDLVIAVRMGMLIEEKLGYLKDPELKIEVIGSPCLADCLQGLTRARFANPPRFSYRQNKEIQKVECSIKEKILTITVKPDLKFQTLMDLADDQIFIISLNSCGR